MAVRNVDGACVDAWRSARMAAAAGSARLHEESGEDEDADLVWKQVEASLVPDPDRYGSRLQRLVKNHRDALSHAGEVLRDRTLALFDVHYDEIIQASAKELPRQAAGKTLRNTPHAHHVDKIILEARANKRCVRFSLPEDPQCLLETVGLKIVAKVQNPGASSCELRKA